MNQEEQLATRQRAIRDLCQGDGLSVERAAELDVEVRLAFGSDDPARVRDLIVLAASLMPHSPHVEAIRNALAIDNSPEGNLTERRAALLEHREITYRTLVRHEDEGAWSLARMIDRVGDLIPAAHTRKALELTTFDTDEITALNDRVRDLEAMVSFLLDVVDPRARTQMMLGDQDRMRRVVGRGSSINAFGARKIYLELFGDPEPSETT